MKQRKIHFLLILFAGLAFLPGLKGKNMTEIFFRPPSLEHVPRVLWAGLLPPLEKSKAQDVVVTKNSYLSEQIAFIRLNGLDGRSLSITDYHAKVKSGYDFYLDNVKKIFEVYDENKDGTATLEEATHSNYKHMACVTTYMHKPADYGCASTPEFLEKQKQARIKFFQARDTDKDGLVEVSKISDVEEEVGKKLAKRYNDILDYVKLDQNGDDILTDRELKSLAETVFDMLDKDQNSALSTEEQHVLMTSEKSLFDLHSFMRPRKYCGYNNEGKRECVMGSESAALFPKPKENKQ